eukprot:Awhi_evm1s4090
MHLEITLSLVFVFSLLFHDVLADCTGVTKGVKICLEECGIDYYICNGNDGVTGYQTAPSGYLCYEGELVLSKECDAGVEISPMPSDYWIMDDDDNIDGDDDFEQSFLGEDTNGDVTAQERSVDGFEASQSKVNEASTSQNNAENGGLNTAALIGIIGAVVVIVGAVGTVSGYAFLWRERSGF